MKFKSGDIIKHKTYTNLEVISKITIKSNTFVEGEVLFCENKYLYTCNYWKHTVSFFEKCQKADKIWYLLYG